MKAAIIGMGPMGRRYVTAFARVPALQLVGVCDANPDALAKLEEIQGVGRHTSAADLFARERPELVVIATTAPSHLQLTLAAIEAGAKAILCEKPVEISMRRAQALEQACRAAGVRLAVNHGRRHEAAYHWVAERIRSGEWGELRGMHVSCPGIGLGCLGTHFIDLMRFLSGEDMKCLTGFLDPERGPNPRGAAYHDPGGLLVAQGSNGTRFVLHQIEDGGGPHHIRLDLTGARVLIDERDRRMDVLRRVAPGKFEPDPLPAGRELRLDLLQICADILTELSNGGALTCTADNANRALEAILAGHLSHQAGNRPVSLPLTDPAHLDFEVAIT